jgi:peptidoglycan/xylan/chitin deacetylase (PgdA/CDA1 family)
MRRLIFLVLRLSFVPFLIREIFQRRRITIIAYHDPSPELFDAHLSVLTRLYSIVSLAEYVDAMEGGTVNTLPPKALIITLDDGHRGNHALRAVIARHNVPVTIFLCSGLLNTRRRFWFRHDAAQEIVQQLKTVQDVERLEMLRQAGFEEMREFADRQALSATEVAELKPVVDFQSHSVFHPILPRCDSARAAAEITQSKQDLQMLLATRIYAFAFPDGKYSDREVRLLEKAGYRCGLTLDLGFNSANTSPFRLRRICVPDAADHHELLVKASGLWGSIKAITDARNSLAATGQRSRAPRAG